MEVLLSPASLQRQVAALAAGEFLQDPVAILEDALELYQPPERISTVENAEAHRILPGAEAGAKVRYDRWLTPYNVGPMNSLDDPACNLLVMVKPSRSGGTTVAENYLFKMIRLGPMGHVSWILNSDEAVTDYCRNVIKPMFELNPDIEARIGRERGENTDSFKRIAGYPVEWLSAKDSTFRNREPIFMVSDETDAWAKKYAATPKVQIEGRQKRLGTRRKGAIMSHPDLGWTSGVASCFEDSSRGVFVMRCANRRCRKYASAYATKFWDEIPEFKLAWTKNPNLPNDARISLAERSAHMLCPHCGAKLTDKQRRAMVDEAVRGGREWLHRGQTFDALEGVLGEMSPDETHGYWVHGLLLKSVTVGKLAREYEAALVKFERTQDVSVLKEFLSKALGEIFEGAATTGGVSAKLLKDRVREAGFDRGMAPDGVRFVTAAVDTGGRYFDVMFIGWDLDGRGWLLDRLTIRQRLHTSGEYRDVSLAHNIEDWNVLLPQVADRLFEMEGRAGWALPVAVVCIDSGDGNVTWKAREFARRALRKGYTWRGWSKMKLIKGVAGKRPIIPVVPRKVDKDEMGRPADPVIVEYDLGVDRLKELTIERLAIGSKKVKTGTGHEWQTQAGQVFLPRDLEGHYVDQFFGETLIDGKWKRSGPNESLDLYGYNEAARLLLRPDDERNIWNDENRLPVWARPVPLLAEGGDPKSTGAKARESNESLLARFDRAVNQTDE